MPARAAAPEWRARAIEWIGSGCSRMSCELDEERQALAQAGTAAGSAAGKRRAWKLWLREAAISLGVSIFIIVFLYQPVKVEGTSMMPGLADQERIFINKFAYRLEPIERGDVVVFRYPGDASKNYI